MLTPYFEISQTDKTVFLTIKALMANVKDAELIVEDETLIFFSSPYYLRLNLPGKVTEDPGCPAKYDADAGEFHFQMLKCTPGEDFKDLDLIAKLLVPKKQTTHLPDIQLCPNAEEMNEELEDEEDWFIDQEVVPSPQSDENTLPYGYGFGLKYRNSSREIKEEFDELLEASDAMDIIPHDRTDVREEYECEEFSDDHYAADFMEPQIMSACMEFKDNTDYGSSFTREDKELLRQLGNKEYLLDKNEKLAAFLGITDILYAYCYDRRTTCGEHTVGSAWTINKLSSTLSWFDVFSDLKVAKNASYRRALTYPLYRNWELCDKVAEDTVNILKSGRKGVLKCFCRIHKLFQESYPRYVLNQLYINDYCIWLQHVSDRKIKKLGDTYEQIIIEKDDIEGFDLKEVEDLAILQLVNPVRSRSPSSSEEDSLDSDDSSDTSSETDSSDGEGSSDLSDEEDSGGNESDVVCVRDPEE